MQQVLATLDLRHFTSGSPASRQGFVSQLSHSLSTTGFFFLKNHGISPRTLAAARQVFATFFHSFTEAQRKRYEFPEERHHRGYTPMRIETGEFAIIPDEKHFFQIGEDRNVQVDDIPGFTEATDALFAAFQRTARQILQAIALSLDLPENHFSDREGNSVMRAIDYPPTEQPLEDDGVATRGGNVIGMCASKHTDINMITLLEAREEGLQLWEQDSWLPVTITSDDMIIVNAGDMLEHLTGGRYKSGMHRVVCQRNVRRFSIPYFCHMNPEESIVPLKHLGVSDLNRYPYQTVGEYLDVRLAQIGL